MKSLGSFPCLLSVCFAGANTFRLPLVSSLSTVNSGSTPSSSLSCQSRREYLASGSALVAAASAIISAYACPPTAIASTASTAGAAATGSNHNDRRQPFLMNEAFEPGVTKAEAGRSFFPTLTPPVTNRATVRYNLGRGTWALEQLLAFGNVTATIRTTVVQLGNNDSGNDDDIDLWVHSPQWPTGEFCALLDEIPGRVRHVVLPCNTLEHKAPMRAFLKKYAPHVASVWIAPGQYGPFGTSSMSSSSSSGSSNDSKNNMGYRVDGVLGNSNSRQEQFQLPPWANEFDYSTLLIDLPENAGPVSETIFVHKPTKTLIATDAVVFIPSKLPNPDIYKTYFDADVVDDEASFWPKTVLQSVFLPLRQDASGSYPGFDALSDRLVRAPILRGFNDARAPAATVEWINAVCQWNNFDRVVASHFCSPIGASPRNIRDAFGYLFDAGAGYYLDSLPPVACQDWELLDNLNKVIAENKLGAPATFDYKVGCQ